MNIGIVCYPTYGGSGIVATELGMEMSKKGHNVHFISYSLPARLDVTIPNIFFHQVHIEEYELFHYQPYSLALSTLMVEIAENNGLDLIHVHYAIPHAYAAYIAKQILKEKNIELPIITTLHGTDITLVGKHPSYQSAVEFSINKSDVVTTVSQSLKQDTYEVFNIEKDIQVIPNFIDNSLYKFDCKDLRENLAQKQEKIVIHVSNLRKVKRVTDVIKIFNEIQKKVECKLIIVGEGPELEAMNNLINEFHLQDKVRILGKVKDLNKILCISDLFLLPSSKESFGLAALEAMAAGVPVVSSNAGGIPEVNIENSTGFLRDIGDVEAMSQASIKLLSDDEKLEQFKKNARQNALKFDLNQILPQYEKLYQSVIKKNA
ncbi:N-acetyl-alpha-D-glucosaminyl L-malate synthase BshA [Candidatus Ornithobacterium hominis]|uniref:N-acetyl-alpha-D-glucosaminyl L-malate synthase BshA n=1 Tax=Candidatus Ornithobacterium hominis TaxID=2497989 RepID=UPI0024BD0CDC|nr:N-acetyl-alpha-D-glucosaminyl L-malate synthase BshA [Candidatus Ornithobacterium hominis]CAI9428978.1 N-acetyl-alpha-D-glucosaminyl L-malate synthase BshA [Candidatus Ornithobacterium hominis]